MRGFHEERIEPLKAKRKSGDAVILEPRITLQPFAGISMSTAAYYLVKGIIPRAGLAIVWGPPKCGKSFWTFDLVMHIALGWEYRGRRVQQGPVVYLALEGGHGFRNRVEAWRRQHLNGHRGAVPFFLVDVPVDLIADRGKLIQAIKAQLLDEPPVAVVIDTLNRALIGDENRSDDMAKFIRAADMIRTAFGCVVIIIHHCGVAGSRPRGHTSLTGADDAQIAVERNSQTGIVTVRVEHMKDGDASAPIACKLERIELGTDDEGDAITSCVVVPVADVPTAGKSAGARMTDNQNRFLDILRDALLDPPDAHKSTINIPGGRTAISREWLKTCCISKGWLEDDGSNKSRAKLSEMINTLAGKRIIGTSKLFVWLAQ